MSRECWMHHISFDLYFKLLSQNVTWLGHPSSQAVGISRVRGSGTLDMSQVYMWAERWNLKNNDGPTTSDYFPQMPFPVRMHSWEKGKNKTSKPSHHCPAILVKCQVRSRDSHRMKTLSLKGAVTNTVHWRDSKILDQSQFCGISRACILFNWTVLKFRWYFYYQEPGG